MGAVVLDASVAIAFLDLADAHNERAAQELADALGRGQKLLIPVTTYAEILVHPLRRGTDSGVERFFDEDDVRVVAIDRGLGRLAAGLRASHRSLRLGDALALAVAHAHRAALLTFDERLGRIARESLDGGAR